MEWLALSNTCSPEGMIQQRKHSQKSYPQVVKQAASQKVPNGNVIFFKYSVFVLERKKAAYNPEGKTK